MARIKWKTLLCACSFCILVSCLLLQLRGRQTKDRSNEKVASEKSRFLRRYSGVTLSRPDNRKKVLILLWTNFLYLGGWLQDDIFKHCPVSNCGFTEDKKQLPQSDVVVFYARNMHDRILPLQKWPHQRWLLFNVEPPYLSGILPQRYNNLFNWTMTYRQDSDFVHSYNQVERIEASSNFTSVQIGKKTKLAIAMISNCFATNNRLEYIRKLQSHMRVDFYGSCSGHSCSPTACNDEAMKKYKFYLAFENGKCLNYITEKFWNPLQLFEAVPVVMGGSSPRDYEQVAPPGSYINTADFSSPKELATYLLKLDKNDQPYMEYHKWRRNYRVKLLGLHSQRGWKSSFPPHPAWCDLCAASHNSSLPAQVYTDLQAWYSKDTCPYDNQNVFCTSWNRCCFRKKSSDLFRCYVW